MGIPISRLIELSVTGGLGYDSCTDFSRTRSFYSESFNADQIKNTIGGLHAHLREIERPEFVKYGKKIDSAFSSNNRMMHILSVSNKEYSLMKRRNQKLVDKAYNLEARRDGRFKAITRALIDRAFHIGPEYWLSA